MCSLSYLVARQVLFALKYRVLLRCRQAALQEVAAKYLLQDRNDQKSGRSLAVRPSADIFNARTVLQRSRRGTNLL